MRSKAAAPRGHDWITTFTGRKFYPLHPQVEDIDIRDIAHALSNQCRFTGHVRQFYSVAQHSILVSQFCVAQDALWGLLHDSAEAYLIDVARPVKHTKAMKPYNRAETRLVGTICKHFGLPDDEPASVKETDRRLLLTEARQFLSTDGWNATAEPLPITIKPLSPIAAERAFLSRFHALTARLQTARHPWGV